MCFIFHVSIYTLHNNAFTSPQTPDTLACYPTKGAAVSELYVITVFFEVITTVHKVQYYIN